MGTYYKYLDKTLLIRVPTMHIFMEKLSQKLSILVIQNIFYGEHYPGIQEGQLSVSGERMCTILINCLPCKSVVR